MKTKQAIQSSAKVMRITEIKAGDVYKRFGDSSDDVKYGVVRGIYNDGEETVIEATEYSYKYWDVDVDFKVIRGDENYTLFPAKPEELDRELGEAKEKKEEKIKELEDDLKKAKKVVADLEGLIEGTTQKKLNEVSFEEMTQEEYEKLKAE